MRKWLVAKRDESGLSQKIVSERVGIAQPSYCMIEAGTRNPTVTTAKKIAEVLGFDWTLFYEEDST